jgi:hypothetical protein
MTAAMVSQSVSEGLDELHLLQQVSLTHSLMQGLTTTTTTTSKHQQGIAFQCKMQIRKIWLDEI